MRIHYISALFMIDLTAEELKQYFSDDIFKRISETADELGLECYVVGGYVRDIFLQRPSKDIDVVVVGSGIAMAEALGKRLGRGAHVSVFKNFGTAQLKYYGTEVEFVGARKESYTHDSRKPIVEDGTLEDDQQKYFQEVVRQINQFADRMFIPEKGLYLSLDYNRNGERLTVEGQTHCLRSGSGPAPARAFFLMPPVGRCMNISIVPMKKAMAGTNSGFHIRKSAGMMECAAPQSRRIRAMR